LKNLEEHDFYLEGFIFDFYFICRYDWIHWNMEIKEGFFRKGEDLLCWKEQDGHQITFKALKKLGYKIADQRPTEIAAG